MLWFERRVVEGLTTSEDHDRRREVAAFVDGALHSMPEHLRFALVAASLGLGAWSIALGGRGPTVRSLDTSPIPQLRQYVRVFRSLVLFAEEELPAPSAPPAPAAAPAALAVR
jgi:hypothetical protein